MLHAIVGLVGLAALTYAVSAVTSWTTHTLNLIKNRDGKPVYDRVSFRLFLMGLLFVGLGGGLALHLWPAVAWHINVLCGAAVLGGFTFGVHQAKAKVIKFYRVSEPYGEWSNFAEYPIVDGDTTWLTSEHMFQADKFTGTDPEHQRTITRAPSGKEAARLGRDRDHQMRPDWEKPNTEFDDEQDQFLDQDWNEVVGPPGVFWLGGMLMVRQPMLVKDYSMLKAVRLKVRQHAELRQQLLTSGDTIYIEHTENDRYWADGGDGYGRNMLGKIIMIVRNEERRRDAAGR